MESGEVLYFFEFVGGAGTAFETTFILVLRSEVVGLTHNGSCVSCHFHGSENHYSLHIFQHRLIPNTIITKRILPSYYCQECQSSRCSVYSYPNNTQLRLFK